MRVHLTHVENPTDVSLQTLLPGINDRFNHLHADFSAKFSALNSRIEQASMKSSSELQYVLKEIGHIDISVIDEVDHDKENNNPPSTVFQYTLFKGHKSYHSIYHEWYGTNSLDYNINTQCFKGGIYGLESEYGSGWRAAFTAAEQK
jgi:hypothetical protein